MDEAVGKKQFYSIEGQHASTIKIKRSIFICALSHVQSIDEAKQFISGVSRENRTATHNCWAYILGDQGGIFHSSDAGEPPGTAGKPILNMLKKNEMTKVAAVVTRHFGGVKLGVRGLMEAYGESVQATIDKLTLRKVVKSIRLKIEVSYEFNETLLNLVKKYLVRINHTGYAEKIDHRIEIAKENEKEAVQMLKEYQGMGKLKFELLD